MVITSEFFYATIRTIKRALNDKILTPFGIKS